MIIRDMLDKCCCELTIAIEGCDAIGKATQTRLLASRINRLGFRSSKLIEVPVQDNVSYDKIYEMLDDGRAKQYPATFQALHILNRVLYQESALKDDIAKHDVMIFDRWNASSYAYGRASGVSHDELMCELTMVHDVDLTIILDGEPFAKSDKDTYEADAEFQACVRQSYIEWGKSQQTKGHVYIVNCNDTIEAVHEAIWTVCSEFWNKIRPTSNIIDIMPHIQAKIFAEELKKEIKHDENNPGPEVC